METRFVRDAAAPIRRVSALQDRQSMPLAQWFRGAYPAAQVRVLASPRRDRVVRNAALVQTAGRFLAGSCALCGAAYPGATVRTSSRAPRRACNAAPLPLCSDA